MRKLLIAISFFTRLPITLKDVTEDEFYECMIYMPIVGVLVGGLLYAVAWACSYINVLQLQALLTMIAYIWITGGLHLDGFADTTDALFSARDRKKMMEIMKDSRLGAFGAIGLILLFLTIWSCYIYILPVYPLAILIMPVIGRYCAIQSACFSTYAEGGGGLGKRIVEMTTIKHVIIYLVILLPVLYFGFGLLVLAAAVITMVLALCLMAYLKYKFGGMTGDTIGMTIELMQVIYLVILTIVLANWPTLVG